MWKNMLLLFNEFEVFSHKFSIIISFLDQLLLEIRPECFLLLSLFDDLVDFFQRQRLVNKLYENLQNVTKKEEFYF